MKRGIFLIFMCLASVLSAGPIEPRGIEVSRAVDQEIEQQKTSRGGSLSLEPAYLIPMGKLEDDLGAPVGLAVNFDVGITSHHSWVFGISLFEFELLKHRDAVFRLVPAWMGWRVKYRIPPVVESWWEVAAAGYYESLSFESTSSAKQEYLTGGGLIGTGISYNLTRWFSMGANFRIHFISEEGELYPMLQFGLQFGVRG